MSELGRLLYQSTAISAVMDMIIVHLVHPTQLISVRNPFACACAGQVITISNY